MCVYIYINNKKKTVKVKLKKSLATKKNLAIQRRGRRRKNACDPDETEITTTGHD